MVAIAQRRLATWRDGEDRDLHEEMMQITYEIVGKTLFDADVGDQAADVRDALAVTLEHYQRVLSSFWILLPDSIPTPANLQLRYTAMVVSEVLRLYPPAWGIARQAVETCEIGGYRVPKGSIVLMSQAVMHRDPRYFDDPDSFKPERWADGLAKQLPKYAYFP